jgi:hypothetical protein
VNTGWEQALEVQGQLLKQISGPFWKEMGGLWLRNRLEKYGQHATLPSMHAFRVAGEMVAEAEPIYVTGEMLDLTLNAMETFDTTEDVRPEDFFLRSGMALLEKPFIAVDADGLETAWRAVTWRYVELPEEASVDGEVVPSLEIILWWDTADIDEWDLAHPETVAFAREIYRSWGMRWAVMHATLCPLNFMSHPEHMGNEGDPAASWMTFIRVFNRLLEERIVLKTRMRPHRAVRRSATRLGLAEPKDVIVCELRRARPRGFEWEGGDGESHLSHRFLVHGHWRNQACGPKLSLRRQRWIAPYVKGPDDKPFIDKKRVWIWDR